MRVSNFGIATTSVSAGENEAAQSGPVAMLNCKRLSRQRIFGPRGGHDACIDDLQNRDGLKYIRLKGRKMSSLKFIPIRKLTTNIISLLIANSKDKLKLKIIGSHNYKLATPDNPAPNPSTAY
jgi:hypothetical protein